MKKTRLISMVIVWTGIMANGGIREEFAQPSDDTRLQCWYHWTTTALTDETLAADFKAMGEMGIGTAHVFMPNQHGKCGFTNFVTPLSETWWQRWQTALREAKRNHIKLGFHNCGGWSSSGGPWIKPEDSMKAISVSATDITGSTGRLPLAQPLTIRDFYRDIAVFALPISAPPKPTRITADFEGDIASFADGKAVLQIPVAKGEKGGSIIYEFAAPYAPTALVTEWDETSFYLEVAVSASADGNNWKEVARTIYRLYAALKTPKVLSIPNCPAGRFFKIDFISTTPPSYISHIRRKLKSATLSNLPLVANIDNKNSAGRDFGYQPPKNPDERGIALKAVREVSEFFKGGVLDLDAAQLAKDHAWRILRIGYTTTGKQCAPAPMALRGLECDKLAKRGLDAHWPHMPLKIITAPEAKDVVTVAIIDSWEVGGQNWTETFLEDFRRLRGYDLRPWLPAMAGYVLNTEGETARLLFDVQLTVSDLMATNYFDYFAEKCHALGIKTAFESYGGPFDQARCFKNADIPTGEFWLGGDTHHTPRKAASVGHLHGRQQIAAESFTTNAKEGRWQITPHELRVNGDRGWVDGLSQLVYHSYLQQPCQNVKPGISLWHHGTQLNRHTTWWPEGRWWSRYVQRGQTILQRGQSQSDLLIFSGDGIPNNHYYQGQFIAAGYSYDYIGADDLQQLEVRDGGIAMPGCRAYPVLWLGNDRYPTVATLKKVRALLQAGARIAGCRAIGTPSLADDAAEWNALHNEIWSGNYANLKAAENTDEVIRAFKLRSPMEGAAGLRAVHRVIEGRDFYFVVNSSKATFDSAVSFAGNGRPERWDAKNGEISPLDWYEDEAGRVKTRITLQPEESIFVSFRDPQPGERAKAVDRGLLPSYAEIKIVSARFEAQTDPSRGMDVTKNLQTLIANGTTCFQLTLPALKVKDPAPNMYKQLKVSWTADGVAHEDTYKEYTEVCFQVPHKVKEVEKPILAEWSNDWTITSFAGPCAPQAPLKLAKLAGWETANDAALKYFSGRAIYEKRVKLPPTKKPLILDLGEVKEIANVTINGRFLGCLWETPYRIALPSEVIKSGECHLRIEVINTWPNRMIGDAKARANGAAEPLNEYGMPKWVVADRADSGTGIYTWSNWLGGWTAADTPRPAGLLGPVRLLAD